jgi:hypothetical protein
MTLKLNEIKIKDYEQWSEMKTDEDLHEVTKDIVNDYKAEKAMDLRKSEQMNRRTAQLSSSSSPTKDLKLEQ